MVGAIANLAKNIVGSGVLALAAGIAAFNREAAKRGLRIVTSQSISADSGDFTTAYRELAQNRARVVVLFCQSRDAAAFLSGALDYVKDGQPHPVAGPGFL